MKKIFLPIFLAVTILLVTGILPGCKKDNDKGKDEIKTVIAGGYHTLILKTDKTLWATGENSSGQLGDGTGDNRHALRQIMTNVAAAAAGGYHTLILKTDKTLWAAGLNISGQLGDATILDRLHFIQVPKP